MLVVAEVKNKMDSSNTTDSNNKTDSSNTTDSNNKTIGLHDFNIPVTFYDYSVGHDDFSSLSGILPTRPYYVVSPLGSWLAVSNHTMTDSVSDWFRSTDTNVKVDGGILLSYVANITTSEVFRYLQYTFCYPGNMNLHDVMQYTPKSNQEIVEALCTLNTYT